MFRLLRYYSVTSLIAVVAAAALLTWYYRQVSIQGIVALAERSNLTLAQAVMTPLKPALLEFLTDTANFLPNGERPPPLPPKLAESVKILMQDRTISRIKIYNRHGVVVFSTLPSQTGGNQSQNQGFRSAIMGEVASALIYRDTFNDFDGQTEEDNLTHTYIPVQAGPAEPIQGVFEVYTDVNRLVLMAERTEFIIMVGAVLILSSLYAVLLLIVRRASNIIEMQQRTIRERTETLELLSAQMLKSEESNKKKIAFELHEGLAQNLAALKLQAENVRLGHEGRDAAAASLDRIIPVLQEAIHEVRTIATDLRPPSLDDLGLLPTISGFCREFEQQYPSIRIERQISLEEQDIPLPLKPILYRIIVSVLNDMAPHASTGMISLALWLEDNRLLLLIDDTAAEALDKTAIPLGNIDPQLRAGFARMEELTTLSGGEFSASHHAGGGTT
ncbi:MAG: sensor histidine kinase, partial [Hyphomicrobiaceae bacterium]